MVTDESEEHRSIKSTSETHQLAELVQCERGKLFLKVRLIEHLVRGLGLRHSILAAGNAAWRVRTRLTNCASKEKSRAHSMQCSIWDGNDFSVQNGTSAG